MKIGDIVIFKKNDEKFNPTKWTWREGVLVKIEEGTLTVAYLDNAVPGDPRRSVQQCHVSDDVVPANHQGAWKEIQRIDDDIAGTC